MITTSLPSLNNFKFYFQFKCRDHQLDQLKQVVASFSTPFYTLEKNWFVRCDVSARHEQPIYDVKYGILNENMRHTILYTIPFSFEEFTVFKAFSKTKISDWSRNYLDHRSISTHANMKTLIFKCYSAPDPMFNRSSIINLIINTSFDSLAWVHILTKLRHITIGDGAVLSSEDFNILLDNASHLHRVIQKFSELAISIQGNDIPSISLHHIFEVVVVIFHGKFHPFNSLLRYPFEVNNRYKIDLLGYYPC